MLSALLSCTESFCSLYRLTSKEAGDAGQCGRGHSQDNWPQITRGIFHTIWHHVQHITWEKKKKGREIRSDNVCLPKSPLYVMEPWFPEDGWTPACSGEGVNEFVFWLCMSMQLLLYLLKILSLNPQVFLLLPFIPPRENEQTAVGCLVVGWGSTMRLSN